MIKTIHQQEPAVGKEDPADRYKIEVDVLCEIIEQRIGGLVKEKEKYCDQKRNDDQKKLYIEWPAISFCGFLVLSFCPIDEHHYTGRAG